MAIMKLSAIGITNLSGKSGGSIFSRNRGGNYVKNFAVPTNPDTASQQSVRARFGSISASWRNLTQSQRDHWKAQAPNYPSKNSFGDEIILSGFGVYQKLNSNLLLVESTMMDTPRAPMGTGVLDGLTLDLSQTTDGVTTVMIAEQETVLLDQSYTKIAIYATPPLSAGKTFVESSYRFIGYKSMDTAPQSIDILAMYEAVFGTPTLESNIGVKTTAISTMTGQRGNTNTAIALVKEVVTP